ncbi:MAG: leucine-rich repeat domain-containing protein [Ruminococcus sp.]|nr:leucine-rich repeat domain-containing protein [Ruminococcus sp.]
MKKIGVSAFGGCSKLKEVVLYNGLISIGETAFGDCVDLKNIRIPASVDSIGEHAFDAYNYSNRIFTPLANLTLECYRNSAAVSYALANSLNFKVIDATKNIRFPTLSSGMFNTTYHQFRLSWTPVDGAQQYGIAVKLAGKWKLHACTDAKTTNFTSPKLSQNSKYDMVICAKINGKWDTSALTGRSFTVIVK